jgi:hypothetical protein
MAETWINREKTAVHMASTVEYTILNCKQTDSKQQAALSKWVYPSDILGQHSCTARSYGCRKAFKTLKLFM